MSKGFSITEIPARIRRGVLEERIGRMQAELANKYYARLATEAEEWPDAESKDKALADLDMAITNHQRALAVFERELRQLPKPKRGEGDGDGTPGK